jgi:APA family basic amino acid/polyamine antiporter
VLTATKFGLLILLVAVPLLTSGGDPAALSHPGPERTPGELIGVITDGLLLCFFSFSGAYFVTKVAGELRNPQRDIPRAIALGFGASSSTCCSTSSASWCCPSTSCATATASPPT